MRSLGKLSSLLLAIVALSACGKLDEGVNAHNLSGTLVIPDAILGTNDEIGMIYVGVFSGVDTRLGYPSPVTAPAQSSAGANAFPYGGTSVGTFANRDIRYVCQRVVRTEAAQQVGANWELDFEILQFPFYEGATVWAFIDQRSTLTSPAFTTCNQNSGYNDYPQALVDLLSVTPTANAGEFDLTLDQALNYAPFGDFLSEANNSPCEPGGEYCTRTLLLDEGGRYWEVEAIDDVTKILTVSTPVGGSGEPNLDQGVQSRVFIYSNDPDFSYPDYGTQYQDILNFPSTYVTPGDIVSDGSAVLNDLSHVTVTVDTVIP